MVQNLIRNEGLLARFSLALARKIGGYGATIEDSVLGISSDVHSNDLLVLREESELFISLNRTGLREDPETFLSLVRAFDSIFPSFKIGTSNFRLQADDYRRCFRLLHPGEELHLEIIIRGSFSSLDTQYLHWFILSQELLAFTLMAVSGIRGEYSLALYAETSNLIYHLDFLGEDSLQRQLFKVKGEESQVLPDKSHGKRLGTVSFPVSELSLFLAGEPLALRLPVEFTIIDRELPSSAGILSFYRGIVTEKFQTQETF